MTLTLTEFLLARIAEDEADAEDAKRQGISYLGDPLQDWMVEVYAPRMLAECEAKRRIVERFEDLIGDRPPVSPLDEDGWVLVAWETLYDLASMYADHPDYRDEWRS
jgi:hypothetical protein